MILQSEVSRADDNKISRNKRASSITTSPEKQPKYLRSQSAPDALDITEGKNLQ
jgi:hypothetical protein